MTFKQTKVKARRIREVTKAILTNPPDDTEIRKEMEADLNRINTLTFGKVKKHIDTCGDNYTFDFYNNVDQFEELEVKYTKAPKIAVKNL